MTRQQILDREDPPRVRVVLNEGAVRRLVGGREVMRAQLGKLVADRDRGNVMVQVLPFSAGEHTGDGVGPFDLLEFPRQSTGVVTIRT